MYIFQNVQMYIKLLLFIIYILLEINFTNCFYNVQIMCICNLQLFLRNMFEIV